MKEIGVLPRAIAALVLDVLPMNSVFVIFLFAMSLLAIAAACTLLVFIAKQMRLEPQVESEQPDGAVDSDDLNEGQAPSHEVAEFLSKMKAATLIGASRPQKRIDDRDVN